MAETKNRAVLLDRAEQNLAEAHAARASAKAASLISRIDMPDAGIYPIGPSRIVIALGGIVGGLLAGFGVVFLAVPSPQPASSQTATATNGNAEVAAPVAEPPKACVAGNRRLSLTEVAQGGCRRLRPAACVCGASGAVGRFVGSGLCAVSCSARYAELIPGPFTVLGRRRRC